MGSNINPDEINGFLRDLHPSTYEYDQPSYFGSSNDPRWVPSVTGSDLRSEVDYSEYDDARSEYRTASTVTSNAYTMRSAAPPSIFSSRHGAASSVGASTAPSLGGPRVPFAGQFDTFGTAPRRPDQTLWCEFAELKNCPATFALDDESRWIEHHAGHLRDRFPNQLMCWFCDHVPFVAQHSADRFANFEERMQHVRGHIFHDHLTNRAMRRDLHMVQHLYDNGLLSREEYNAAMRYDETPAAFRLPNSHSSSSSSNAPLGYQYAAPRERGQCHDLAKEDRHRHREKKQGHGHGRKRR